MSADATAVTIMANKISPAPAPGPYTEADPAQKQSALHKFLVKHAVVLSATATALQLLMLLVILAIVADIHLATVGALRTAMSDYD